MPVGEESLTGVYRGIGQTAFDLRLGFAQRAETALHSFLRRDRAGDTDRVDNTQHAASGPYRHSDGAGVRPYFSTVPDGIAAAAGRGDQACDLLGIARKRVVRIVGAGKKTNIKTGEQHSFPFGGLTDMRFMTGTFISGDGKEHHGTFGFV